MIQPLQSHVNIVIVNSQPHKCLSAFDNPNITISILSSNRINCECNACCYQTGGFFLPNSESISIEQLCEVYNSSIRYSNKFITIPEHSLLFPGYHLIFDQMPIVSSSPSTPIQIIIESNDRTFALRRNSNPVSASNLFFMKHLYPTCLLHLGNIEKYFPKLLRKLLIKILLLFHIL